MVNLLAEVTLTELHLIVHQLHFISDSSRNIIISVIIIIKLEV